MVDISLFITNWNGFTHGYIQEAFPSIRAAVAAYRKGACEVVVVDDVSRDESVAWMREHYPDFSVVIPERNLGYQEASNFAARHCRHEILVSLNNDIKLDTDVLNRIVEHFSDPEVFAVSTKVLLWDEKTYLAGRRYPTIERGLFLLHDAGDTVKTVSPTLFATGGAAAFRKTMYESLGGFQRIFHPLYWEDVDLCYRALKRGWKVLYDPNCLMYHKHQATITKMYDRASIGLITARNSYLFYWKNITDIRYLRQHLLWTVLFHLRDLCRLRLRFIRASVLALGRIGEVRRLRRREREAGLKFTDAAVLRMLAP